MRDNEFISVNILFLYSTHADMRSKLLRLSLQAIALYYLSNPVKGYSSCNKSITARSRSCKHGTLRASMQKAPRETPGSELFPKAGSSYVPFGLTEEEYEKIKKNESEEKKKMNYGSWGPRFAKSERPIGDWMALPSLWTGGYDSNENIDDSLVYSSKEEISTPPSQQHFLLRAKEMTPAFLLAITFVEVMFTCFSIIGKRVSLSLISSLVKFNASKAVIPMVSFLKINGFKILLASLLSKPIRAVIERWNRRYLLSQRKIIFYALFSMTVLVSSCFAGAAIR